MEKSPVPVLLCSFNKEQGWRVMASSKSDSQKVALFRFGKIKLLKIPAIAPLRTGLYCNPKKQVLNFLSQKG